MNKNRMRLTESQLRRVIKESVRQMLSEGGYRTFSNQTNSLQKAIYVEKCIYGIKDNIERILRVLDDGEEFNGQASDILYTINNIKQMLESDLIDDFDPTNCGAIDEGKIKNNIPLEDYEDNLTDNEREQAREKWWKRRGEASHHGDKLQHKQQTFDRSKRRGESDEKRRDSLHATMKHLRDGWSF